MIKVRVKLLMIAVTIIFVGASGCKKCYRCNAPYRIYLCNSGVDSLGFGATGMHQINDSLNYYQSRDYNCVVFSSQVVNYENLCGRNRYKEYLEDSDWTCSSN